MFDVQDDNQTASVLQRLLDRRDTAVRKTAFAIQGGAAQRSAVDTGAQKNSIYVVSSEGTTYAEAAGAATRANPAATLLPEVALKTDDGSEAVVGVGVAYAEINELTRQAFLTPAVEAERAAFEQAMKELL